MRRENISPEDDNFRVICVEKIQEVFEHALYHEDKSPKKK